MTLRARLLEALAPWRAAPAWRVALSAGLDSTVLLHLLAQLAQREQFPPISAIHIHHGLQAVADSWPEHCRVLCEQLNIPLTVIRVRVESGASIEQAARKARYKAFSDRLGAGEVLLTAQHRDDQAETLLFRLLRGAGVQGLAAMPSARLLGEGVVVRPLLRVARSQLLAYAQEQGLSWVEDPSNADERFARNYLRHRVIPQLEQRWPQATVNIARTADYMAEAGVLLDERAEEDLQAASGRHEFPWLTLPCLDLSVLRDLSEIRQRNVLRYWLRPLTRMPDSEHWAGWVALRDAAPDAAPVWRLEAGEVRRSNGCIWWLSGDWLSPVVAGEWPLEARQELALPGNGRLIIEGAQEGGAVGYRQPGECVQLAERGHRDIKRLFNEWQIPVFVRDRLPLLRHNGEVIAVANMPQFQSEGSAGWRLRWIPPMCDQGLS